MPPMKNTTIRFRTSEEEKALIAEDAKLAKFDDTSSYILFLTRLNRRKLRRE